MKRPYVTIKFAQTLDGRIAAKDGSSRWISGKEARKFAHRLRAQNDAILVGVGTVLADNPSLTTRTVKGKNPVRIIIDGKLRIRLDSKVIKRTHNVKTIVITASGASRAKIRTLREKGVEVLPFPSRGSRISLKKVMPVLYRRGIKRLLVEGGKEIISSFLKSKLADKIIAIVCPKILGAGRETVGDMGINTLKGALELRLKSVKRLGNDTVITATPCFRMGNARGYYRRKPVEENVG